MLHRKIYYRLIISLERRVYRNPKVRLIAVSSLVAKQLDSHFGKKDATVIPNSVDTKRFNVAVREARRKDSRQQFGARDEDFVLLFIGNDWKKKGLDALLKGVAMLRDLPVRVLVVGSGDEPMFRRLLDPLGSDGRVKFQKPSTDVVSFYAAADLYISPALEDAFGLPILEAMACGLPVIASVNAGASEGIREGETGLLLEDPRDASAIAKRIRRLYSDKVLREKIGSAAAEYVRSNCSWDRNAELTKQVLEATLEKSLRK